jgi:threonine/homoserine/homoserine lactone efflux protein
MEAHPIFLAGLAGFFTALIFSSIPVGPVNLTILNEGCKRGFLWAFLIGLGAACMEAIYCSIAFAGFSSFFENRSVKSAMEVISFVFLLFLGSKFLMAKTVNVPGKLDAASEKLGARLNEKLHPHSAFMTGFVRVLGNLGVLGTWLILAAYLMSHDAYFTSHNPDSGQQHWVEDRFETKLACVIGVVLGTMFWFCALSFSVSRGHRKLSNKTLLRMQHVSGGCLLLAGIYGALHVMWQLTRQHHGGLQ